MLRKILREAGFGRTSSHPPLALVVPMDVTNAERKLLAQSASAAGAGRLFLIDQPTSAAISNLLPVAEPFSSALVVIGAGRTEVAVFMLGTMVLSCSIRVSGTSMDRAIVSYVRRNHDLLISESTGERIKLAIGTALAPRDDIIVCIQGRDRISKKPREIFITQADIHEALSDCVATLVEHIRSTLENATPDVSADLIDQGILLAGGGALLPGIAELLSQETGMPVDIADEPMHCAALGAGDALDDQNLKCMFSEYSLR
jgi:rod shape-determining protein MreB